MPNAANMKRIFLPISLIYQVVTKMRNHLYDIGARRSIQFDGLVTIGVGNLSMGGTGKTPVTEYLIRLLKDSHKVAALSRGYGRKTKGLRMLDKADEAVTAGDEPVQLFRKFGNDIHVVVSEDRTLAIPTLLNQVSHADVVILDDSFQHRRIKPDLNILLTKYESPFFSDLIFPMGWLRESRIGARRADVLVVTKCPASVTDEDIKAFILKAQKYAGQVPIFFTRYRYDKPVAFGNRPTIGRKIILVTGIAHSDFLLRHCREDFSVLHHYRFSDHYNYSLQDIREIITAVTDPDVCLLTTEKDMIRLSAFSHEQLISAQPWFYLPVEIEFLSAGTEFDSIVRTKVKAKLESLDQE